MPEDEIEGFENRYIEIVERGLKKYEENPASNKKYVPEYVKAFRRMLKYKEDHLRFVNDFRVPYTNNAAEKQCRVVKGKKKTSGQFVTEQGGQRYVSILQTAKIRKENALETLEHLFQ